MSKWFQSRRQEFITATLRQFGQINRQTIMDQFEVSAPLASTDIQRWLKENPDGSVYDVTARCYIFKEPQHD